MIIRPLKKEDLASVANLHMDYLTTNFYKCIFSLNLFLYFYSSFLNSESDIALVSEIEGHIVGYICLVTSVRILYITSIKVNLFPLLLNYIGLFILQPHRIMQEFFGRTQGLLNFGRSKSYLGQTNIIIDDNIKEMRPIVVRADYQGTLVAEALLDQAEERLKLQGENKYFLRTYRTNDRAINFFRKAGFINVGTDGEDKLIMEKTFT